MKRIIVCKIVFVLFFAYGFSQANFLETSGKSWYILGGAGQSHPGWGNTLVSVKTLDFIIRYKLPKSQDYGSGWYRYKHSLLIEAPLHLLQEPYDPLMVGLYFQSCWIFTAHPTVQPYLFVGGGPVYTKAKIPGTSSAIKGSYGFGTGIFLNIDNLQFSLEARFHHLSNGGIKKPNDPLNSHKILFGIKLNI